MTAIEYQGIYILFVWLGISVGVGLQFGLLTMLILYQRPLKIPRILALAATWTLLEWSRFHFICGYSWNLSGIALSNPISIQFASVFGVLGLTFWVIFSNLLGFRAFTCRGLSGYFAWGVIVVIPYLFGLVHLSYHDRRLASCKKKVNCLLVQTGMLPPEKIPIQGSLHSFICPYVQWKQILDYAAAYKDECLDLIVLPEAAVPFSLNVELYELKKVKEVFEGVFGSLEEGLLPKSIEGKKISNAFWIQSLANILKSDILIGLDYTDPSGASYNSVFFVRPFSHSLERYDKQVLMPLAEYLPYQWLLPLVKAYGINEFFTPGSGARIFEGKVPLSVSICYEETFPSKVREGRRLGGELLVNVTNDGWYPFSRLSSQHFEHARIRTVENGVSMIRACNTGVSAAVDSLGRTIDQLDETIEGGIVQKGAILAQISPYTYSTLFAIWGNSGIVCLSLAILGVFFLLRKVFSW